MANGEEINNTTSLIRRYLLGDLEERDRVALEERLLSDKPLFDELLLMETELADEYARGALADHELIKFESHFAVAPERQRKIAMARALKRYVSEHRSERESFAPIGTIDRPPRPGLARWLAAVAVLVTVVAVWLLVENLRLRGEIEQIRSGSPPEMDIQSVENELAQQKSQNEELSKHLEAERARTARLEQEMSELRAGLSASDGAGRKILSMILQPGTFRDSGGGGTATIGPGVQGLRLQLDLEQTGYSIFRAELVSAEGTVIWRQKNLRIRRIADQRAVVVQVPVRLLPAGDYVMELTGLNSIGRYDQVASYQMRILRP
jgi:hypothetical protein